MQSCCRGSSGNGIRRKMRGKPDCNDPCEVQILAGANKIRPEHVQGDGTRKGKSLPVNAGLMEWDRKGDLSN